MSEPGRRPSEHAARVCSIALAVPRAERQTCLDSLCGGDVELLNEVLAILADREGCDPADALTGVALAAPLPARVGRYEVVGRLAEGGMGRLLRARDTELSRDVVVKTVRRGFASDPAALARLRREARLLSKLDHPNLCPILDVVHDLDEFWVVMPHLKGTPLDEVISAARRQAHDESAPWSRLQLRASAPADATGPTEEACALRPESLAAVLLFVQRVALAVHAAHEAGIVHRDLKPSNLIVLPEGQPVVLDFGLAVSADEAAITTVGQVLGTPGYMAPEQIGGDVASIDRRTDIYALGVLLYELLTLRRPYETIPSAAILQATRRGDAVAPRSLVPSLPRDVEAVCLRAMHPERSARYATAREFAEDLANLRHNRPTVAKPTSTIARLARRALRHRAASALAVCIGALLLLGWSLLAKARNADARTTAAADYRTLRECFRVDRPPPAEVVRRIERAVADRDLCRELLENPLDPQVIARYFESVNERFRGDDGSAGPTLIGPLGAIVDPRPVFEFRTGLPMDREWHFVVCAWCPATGARHEQLATRRAAVSDRLAVELPEGANCAVGYWRWSVALDSARHSESWPEAHGEFDVLPAGVVDAARASAAGIDDSVLQRQVEAAALLQRELATAALARLVDDPATIADPVDRARELELQLRAHAITRNRAKIDVACRMLTELQSATRGAGDHR